MSPDLRFLSSKGSLVDELGSMLIESSGPGGLKDNIVVFPGQRPAHFLRKTLADRVKGAFEPPLILSMDEFVDWGCGLDGLANPKLTKTDASAILYEQCREEIQGFIKHGGTQLTFDDFFAWGAEIFTAFEELKINLVSKRSLSGFDPLLEDAGDFKGDFNGFAKAYEKFYSWTEKNGLSTRASRYVFLSSGMEQTVRKAKGSRNIIFAGFFAFTKSEKEILKKLAPLPNARFLFHKGPGLAGNIDFLGSFDAEAREPIDWRGRVEFHKASDLHGEIFALNRSLEKENSFSSDGVIVVPDPAALFPLMNWTLPLAKGNFNVSMGYPLVSSPFYSMFESLFTLHDRAQGDFYQIDAYLRFILHPYVKNIACKGSSEISRVIFHGTEEVLSRNLAKAVTLENIEKGSYSRGKKGLVKFVFDRLSSYPDIKSADDVREHIKSVHDRTIRPFEEIEDLKDLVEKLLVLVSLISRESTANLHANYDMFVRSLIQNLHQLRTSRLAGMKFESKSSYFRLLRLYLESASAHFAGTPLKGLQALGFLETRGLKFKNVWFLDANEGIIPKGRKEDSLLPYKLRKDLGLTTHKTTEDIFRYYFTVLLGQAGNVNLFYLDTPDHEPSRFVRRIMWEMQAADKKYGVRENEVRFPVSFAQRDPASVKKTPEMLKYTASNINLSPSNLDDYLACPLKFYYGSVLGFDENEGVSPDFEAKDIGILVHDILRSFFSEKTGSPLSIQAGDYALMDQAVDRCFTERYSSVEDGFGYIVKSRIKKRLRDVMRAHESMLPLKILGVEKRIEVPYKSGNFDINLVGKIDRIDDRNGTVWIIDYKSGTSASLPSHEDAPFADRDSWPKKIRSVQLPFYILLYTLSNPGTDVSSMDASLMVLGKTNIDMKESLFNRVVRKNPLALNKAAYFQKNKAVIDTLIAEIFDQELPFAPTSDVKTCAGCDFKIFCGRQWAGSERY